MKWIPVIAKNIFLAQVNGYLKHLGYFVSFCYFIVKLISLKILIKVIKLTITLRNPENNHKWCSNCKS